MTEGRPSGRIRASWQLTLSLALLGLGFLIAAQLAVEGPRVRYTTQERAPLIETALELQERQDALQADILDLRERIGQLEVTGFGEAAEVAALNAELEAARIAAGLIPLHGPGVVFRLEDADVIGSPDRDLLVTARDIRTLVEELFLAGAEAVSINDERVVTATSVLDIGGSVLANSAYLAPPFIIAAIGPEGLYDRVSISPSFVEFVRARVEAAGIRLSFAVLDDVDVPAFAGSVNVRYARPDPSPGIEP